MRKTLFGQLGFTHFAALLSKSDLGSRLLNCFHSFEQRECNEVLGKMVVMCEERAKLPLSKFEAEIEKDTDEIYLRTFYDIFLLYQVATSIPWTPLLILATSILDVCGEDIPTRAAALNSLARTLRSWSEETLWEAEQLVKMSPSHLECNALLPLGNVENSGVQALVELLKLMRADILFLKNALSGSTERQLYVVALVLTKFGIMDQGLLQLKTLMDGPPVTTPSAVASAPTTAPVSDTVLAVENVGLLRLRIAKQPGLKTVYHKILKPFPTVEVMLGESSKEKLDNFLVQAEVCKKGDAQTLPYLDGDRTVAIKDGRFAVFRKLKIGQTSSSIGGHPFQLKFSLLRNMKGGKAAPVVGSAVYSDPIEVFSHTSYLKGDHKAGVPSSAKRQRKKKEDEEDEDEELEELELEEEDE